MYMKKRFTLATLALVMVLGITVGAVGGMTIQVDPVNIQVNGQTFQPKDVNGNDVPVFAYNGTTYAPLRALAEAYGLTVGYAAAQNMATVTDPKAGTSTPAAPTTPATPSTPATGAQSFSAPSLSAKADKEEMTAGELTGFFTNTGKVTKRTGSDGAVKSVEVAKASGGAIEFTLAAPATVKVEFSSTGGSNTSACGIEDATGALMPEAAGLTTVTGSEKGKTTFTFNLAAGSYKVVSPVHAEYDRGARVYSITVE